MNPPGDIVKMPVLFLGHASPMNAIEKNKFTEGFRNIRRVIPRPRAIFCVSAHWEMGCTKEKGRLFSSHYQLFSGDPVICFEHDHINSRCKYRYINLVILYSLVSFQTF